MGKEKILIVDDEKSMRDFLSIMLTKDGFSAFVAENGEKAIKKINEDKFDIVITDIKMADIGGLEVLREVNKISPETRVIMITAYASTETAIEAMREGAFDYITKPFNVDEIKRIIENALQKSELQGEKEDVKRRVETKDITDYIVGDSNKILEICKTVGKIANRKSTVLITGESGTGKELVARAIHYSSNRKDNRFEPINCGALTETLLESELFGHVKGSFTGAMFDKAGLFELADGGTFFLDEISETTKAFQVKMLRILQEQKFKRVGGTNDIKIDVRIIAATNKDLKECIREGSFREDLFYRINVISINVPPLRERRSDIPKLAYYFLEKYSQDKESNPTKISSKAMDAFFAYDWPGNVRELENAIERAVALETGDIISKESLPENIRGIEKKKITFEVDITPQGIDLDKLITEVMDYMAVEIEKDGYVNLEEVVNKIEEYLILRALQKTNGKKNEAAKLLGLTFRSFRYKLDKYEIGENV